MTLLHSQNKLSILSRIVRNRVEYHAKFFDHWQGWCKKIAGAVTKVMPGSTVYVFGSILTGQVTGASDIDILIVVPELPPTGRERASKLEAVEDAVPLPLIHPFQFHLVNPEEATRYFALGGQFWSPLSGEMKEIH